LAPKRSKTLSLQRAYFNEGFNGSLEDILRVSLGKLDKARDRVVPIDLISSQFFAGLEESPSGNGVFVRLLEFEQGAIGVINLDTNDHSAAVEEFFHPNKRDFLKSEMVCLVVGDHIVACNMGNKSRTFASSVLELAAKADVLSGDVRMRIADVPDKTTLARIEEIGVREVDFSIETFFKNLELNTRGQTGTRVMQMIFGMPSDDTSARVRANAIGRMVLKRGRFESEEIRRDQWLIDIGRELMVAEPVDKYKIILEDGSKISNKSLKKSKTVQLNRHANSFSFESAKAELEAYSRELNSEGALGD
jgi:hypothetical protein